jgi:dipeptidyl aminopeptidase/acylaminoacyl peptidase
MQQTAVGSRSKARRRLIVALALIAVVLLIAYSVVAYFAYNFLSVVASKLPVATPEGAYETVTFPARGQNYNVYAYYLEGERGMPAIIQAHGWRSSRFEPAVLERVAKYRSLGYHVLSLDLSDGRGETVGNGRIAMGYEERYDVLGAFDYLLTRGFAPDQIGLTGESMGAVSVILAAAQEPRIRAVWADSPFTRSDSVASEQAETFGFPRIIVPGGMLWGVIITGNRIWEDGALAQAARLAENKTAIQLVHCDQDDFVFYYHSQELFDAYRAAGANVDLWTTRCDKHPRSLETEGERYLARMDAFFRQHLRVG